MALANCSRMSHLTFVLRQSLRAAPLVRVQVKSRVKNTMSECSISSIQCHSIMPSTVKVTVNCLSLDRTSGDALISP